MDVEAAVHGAFLILVETDTDLTGIGESATFGGSMDALEAIVEKQLKPLLLDEDQRGLSSYTEDDVE